MTKPENYNDKNLIKELKGKSLIDYRKENKRNRIAPEATNLPGGSSNILIYEQYYVSFGAKGDLSKESSRSYRGKGRVLFHEFLHSYFNFGETDILTKVLGQESTGTNDGDSRAISQWLRDCFNKTKEKGKKR